MLEEVQSLDPTKKQNRYEDPTLTFENAIYLHLERQDFKKAKVLYLRAIERAICPWPAFCMLLNINLIQAHSKERLEAKLNDLKVTYGPFLSIHNYFEGLLERCHKYAQVMEEDPSWKLKQKTI